MHLSFVLKANNMIAHTEVTLVKLKKKHKSIFPLAATSAPSCDTGVPPLTRAESCGQKGNVTF